MNIARTISNIRRTTTKVVVATTIAAGALAATTTVAGAQPIQVNSADRDSVCETIEARLHTLLSLRIKMRDPKVLASIEKEQQNLEAFYRSYCPQYG